MTNDTDPFALAAEPACAVCGTVLHVEGPGYRCRSCGLNFLATYETPGRNRTTAPEE